MVKPRHIDTFKYNGETFIIEQYGKYTAGFRINDNEEKVIVCVLDTFYQVMDYIIDNY